jgi:hypothetical protein
MAERTTVQASSWTPKAFEDSRSRMQRYEENIGELKSEIAELYLQNQVLKKALPI